MPLLYKNIKVLVVLMAGGLLAACAPPEPIDTIPEDIQSVHAHVDVSEQTMTVSINGKAKFLWDVSTARRGKITPRGKFKAYWLSKNHVSSLYNVPMPYAIFFDGHYAVHSTEWEQYLGRPASAGCVRLAHENAKLLFGFVEEHGKEVFTIDVVD